MSNTYKDDSIESLSALEHNLKFHGNRKYNPGNFIGPNNIYFIRELPPRVYKNGNKKRRGLFKCPYCQKEFECFVDSIISKTRPTRSCGCLHDKQVRQMGQNNAKDITGLRSGMLVALEKTNKKASDNSYIWKCQCDCGKITYVPISDLTGQRVQSCGCSKESHGERKIRLILEQNNVAFKQEYCFKDLKNFKKTANFRFDFYLPEQNTCIEYDGEQHFKERSSDFFQDTLKEIQERDIIKNQYCKHNNIKLIRIPYIDYNKISIAYLKEKGVNFG